MADSKRKSRTFHIYLLKEKITSFEDALKDLNSVRKINLKKGLGIDGILYYRLPKERRPAWINLILPILETKELNLSLLTSAAVLFIRVKQRIFAITFGTGRFLLKTESYEPNFGLKVVLNSVNPEKIKSINVKTYEQAIISTRRDVSRLTDMQVFDIDPLKDILKGMTGKPEDESFAKKVTGTDALTITTEIEIYEIGKKCEDILEKFKSDRYKELFEWVDNIRPVNDKEIISMLDNKIVNALKNENTDKLHFSTPIHIQWDNVDKFKISGTRRYEYDDLDIVEYVRQLKNYNVLNYININKLKSYKIKYYNIEYERWNELSNVYKSLVWETELDNKIYVLMDGNWFEIDKSFSEEVLNYIEKIPISKLEFPHARKGEREDEYNKRVVDEDTSNQFVCMDKLLFYPSDSRTKIEFCDIYSANKEIIHVKKYRKSSNLSHLFGQVIVSADVFRTDEVFRKSIRKKLRDIGVKSNIIDSIPKDQPKTSDYEIVLAIIKENIENTLSSLPFFSQLFLMFVAKKLRREGFRISITLIPIK